MNSLSEFLKQFIFYNRKEFYGITYKDESDLRRRLIGGYSVSIALSVDIELILPIQYFLIDNCSSWEIVMKLNDYFYDIFNYEGVSSVEDLEFCKSHNNSSLFPISSGYYDEFEKERVLKENRERHNKIWYGYNLLKSLETSINESLSVSEEVERESVRILKMIISDGRSEGVIKETLFNSYVFTIRFSIVKDNREIVSSYLDIKSGFIFISSRIVGNDISDLYKTISHEVSHIYDFYMRGVSCLLNAEDEKVYEKANMQLLFLNDIKKDRNLSELEQKMLDCYFALYASFKSENIAELHEFNAELQTWKSVKDKQYENTDIYKITKSIETAIYKIDQYSEIIEVNLGISKNRYLKYLKSGYNYLTKRIGKVITRNFFE